MTVSLTSIGINNTNVKIMNKIIFFLSHSIDYRVLLRYNTYMASAEKKPSFLQNIARGGAWGGIIAGLRLISLSIFSVATANFLAGGALIGAGVAGVIGLLNTVLGPSPAQSAS